MLTSTFTDQSRGKQTGLKFLAKSIFSNLCVGHIREGITNSLQWQAAVFPPAQCQRVPRSRARLGTGIK